MIFEVGEREGPWLRHVPDLNLVPKGSIAVAEQQGNRIARDVGGDEVGDLIPIEVGRRHGRRVLPTA